MSNTRFLALIDRATDGAYGVAFPDLPGCVAMGKTLDDALRRAAVVLAEFAAHARATGGRMRKPATAESLLADPEVKEQLAAGSVVAYVPLVLESGRALRANLSIDAGLLEAIDDAAQAAGLTRSAFLTSAAREKIARAV